MLGSDVLAELHREFGARGPLEPLPGGEGRTFRAGGIVLRREPDDSATEAALIARVYERLPAAGFRVPRPLRTRSGRWLSPGGWSAWTFVAGRPAVATDLHRVIPAVQAFHAALANRRRPVVLERRDTPYDQADRAAWGRLPARVAPPLAPFVAELARLRRPLRLRAQLIHGDLNPDNILVASNAPPALIDMAPYWRPPGLALAVLAYWLGPDRGNSVVLRAFESVPAFDQLLLRAALRSVLIWHELGRLGRSLRGAHAAFGRAVPIVVQWVSRRAA